MPMAKRVGIVLSGTAPAMTLMSGAMLAFAEHDVEFEVISTTGVGGLIGMMYMAPKGGDRQKALGELKNLFVSDWLYKVLPINFKVFHKHSSLAPYFYRFRKALPRFTLSPEEPGELKRLFNDWMELWATALTPASYDTLREAFMSHVPLVQDLVDFDKLNKLPFAATEPRLYLNAFSLFTRRLRVFDHRQVTPDIYNGAQAMFMLFPPVATDHDLLTTGATRDPTGLQAIWSSGERDKLSAVLALDPLTHCFWRQPTDAYDAFQLMLMNPIVALQQFVYAAYAQTDYLVNGRPANPHPAAEPMGRTPIQIPQLFGLPVTIAKGDEPRILKWTHANAVALQEAGHQAGLEVAGILKKYNNEYPDDINRLLRELARFRFVTVERADRKRVFPRRAEQFLTTPAFGPMFRDLKPALTYFHGPESAWPYTHRPAPIPATPSDPQSRPRGNPESAR
jgi:NTE family protein